jgi:hypothetical protein
MIKILALFYKLNNIIPSLSDETLQTSSHATPHTIGPSVAQQFYNSGLEFFSHGQYDEIAGSLS